MLSAVSLGYMISDAMLTSREMNAFVQPRARKLGSMSLVRGSAFSEVIKTVTSM